MGTCMCLSQGDIIPTNGEYVFIYLSICSFIVYARYTGMTGLLTLGFSSKLLASCTSGSRVVDRTCNLEGSARVGVGGAHIYADVYRRRGKLGWGGSLLKQKPRHTCRNTYRQRYRHTHRHALFISPFFHPIGALTLM